MSLLLAGTSARLAVLTCAHHISSGLLLAGTTIGGFGGTRGSAAAPHRAQTPCSLCAAKPFSLHLKPPPPPPHAGLLQRAQHEPAAPVGLPGILFLRGGALVARCTSSYPIGTSRACSDGAADAIGRCCCDALLRGRDGRTLAHLVLEETLQAKPACCTVLPLLLCVSARLPGAALCPGRVRAHACACIRACTPGVQQASIAIRSALLPRCAVAPIITASTNARPLRGSHYTPACPVGRPH